MCICSINCDIGVKGFVNSPEKDNVSTILVRRAILGLKSEGIFLGWGTCSKDISEVCVCASWWVRHIGGSFIEGAQVPPP